jgi:hypothetical protein
MQAPDRPAGVYFAGGGNFLAPVINNAGAVAFRSIVVEPGNQQKRVVYTGMPGALRLLGEQDFAAPGAGGANFGDTFEDICIDETGRVAFQAKLTGTGVTTSNDYGYWIGQTPPSVMVAREGTTTVNGLTLAEVDTGGGSPERFADGTLMYSGRLSGPGVGGNNNSAIWVVSLSGVTYFHRMGDPAGGFPDQHYLYGAGGYSINAAGQVAFDGWVRYNPSLWTYYDIIWRGMVGSVSPVWQSSTQPPGFPMGYLFQSGGNSQQPLGCFGTPVLGSAGDVAFYGAITGPGVTELNKSCLFHETELIARTGTAGPLGSFTSFYAYDLALSSTGGVAFRAQTGAPLSGLGIYAKVGPTLEFVAHEGVQAPDLPVGVTFTWLEAPAINALGQVVFKGTVAGPGITAANDTGIWGGRPGQIRLLARASQIVTAWNNEQHPLGDLLFVGGSSGENGGPTGLNDLGKVAFQGSWLRFGVAHSGIFLVTVPTPAVLGDMNCDGNVEPLDVAPFALALVDPAAYQTAYPSCDIARADMNSDGLVNGLDAQGFVDALL